MNDNLTKLLEQLSAKLGTTTEYLWGVLLKQARVSATTDLLMLVLVSAVGLGIYKIHRKLMQKPANDKYNDSYYHKYEEGAQIPMIFGSIAWFVIFIILVCQLPNIINGYMNPEYWALDNILRKL